MNCKICENTSAKNSSVSFFRFPKENDRCKDWAERCNLLSLHEKHGTLRFYKSFRICSDHFEPKDIVFDGRKNRLLHSAVPKNFLNCKIIKNNVVDSSGNTLTQNKILKLKLVKNLCRLCAEENRNLTDIFGWRGKILNLENKLKFFPLIVNKYDILPLRICHQCISKINQFCDFITNCIEAETKLKIMLDIQHCNSTYKPTDLQDKLTESLYIQPNNDTVNEVLPKIQNTLEVKSPETILSSGNKNDEQNLTIQYEDVEFIKNGSHLNQVFNVFNDVNDINDIDFNKNINFKQNYSNKNLREQSLAKDITLRDTQQNFTEAQYFCDINTKIFPKIDSLNNQDTFSYFASSHQKESICKFCKLKLPNSYYLEDHIYTHTLQKAFKCQICLKSFHKVALLEKHKSIHDNKEKSYIPIIFFKPSEKNSKTVSVCLSSNTKNQIQGLNQNNREQFFKIKKKSKNVRVKRCQFCDKLFKNNEMCSIHEKTHKGETPYECNLCGKCFRSRPSLRQHRSVHSDKRLFSCKECKMRFKRKDTLNNHLRIHTGERPFICKVCGFAFKQRGDCIKHERNHRANELNEKNYRTQKETYKTTVLDLIKKESIPENSLGSIVTSTI